VDELQKKVASLTESERWRLLSWLAVHYHAGVLAGLGRLGGEPLETAAITWKINEPEPEQESAG
jgi:hypothetical protein